MKKYDVAAYIWPSYTGDEPRTRIFWPEGIGEWQTVKDMKPLYPGHQWPRKPLWGYVNEADPYVMEMEIEAAAAHGVNVFIYDWYWFDNRPFLEQCLNNGYLKARNNDKVKFFLMWANHTATSLWDKRTAHMHTPIWDGAVDRKTFNFIVKRTIEKYFSQPSYYKIDGKPVYLLFDIRNLVRGLGGVKQTLEALQYFRDETVKAGFPGLELHLTVRSRKYMEIKLDENTDIFTFIQMVGFDGITHYNFFDYANMRRSYLDVLEDAKAEWKYLCENMNAPYYPEVSMGWDSSPRFEKISAEYRACSENTPENIEKALRMAKEHVDSHPELKAPLVVLNSWNEWTEGTYLQPDDINGYGYLEAVKRVFVDGE
jgi:hypothetical protein